MACELRFCRLGVEGEREGVDRIGILAISQMCGALFDTTFVACVIGLREGGKGGRRSREEGGVRGWEERNRTHSQIHSSVSLVSACNKGAKWEIWVFTCTLCIAIVVKRASPRCLSHLAVTHLKTQGPRLERLSGIPY